MKLIKQLLLILSFFILTVSYAEQEPQPTPVNSSQPSIVPLPPNVDAKAYIVVDANSGYVIAQKNADEKLPPASLTKVMTLYIVADYLKADRIHLTDNVRVSENAWRVGGSRMFIRVGTFVPLDLLIQGIAVASGNDATVAMAEYIAGTEDTFANLMNQTAAKLGMSSTHYTDSNGLPSPDHYTSAADLSKLARAWINDFPQYYSWFSQKWIVYNNIKQPNRNRLLWQDPSVDGFKTGHTDDAGYCLIASSQRNGMRLISILLGSSSDKGRTAASQALLNYGFRFFETHKVYDANAPLSTARVWFGKSKTTSFGVMKAFYVTVPNGQYKNVKINITQDNNLRAPIVKGQGYGKISVMLNDKEVANQPLVALEANKECGFFGRFIDHIHLFFRSLF